MIPLRDMNPASRPPVVTGLILAAIIVVYLFVQPKGGDESLRFTYANAAIPCELVEGRPLSTDEVRHSLGGHDRACADEAASPAPFPDKRVYLAALASMFLHGGLLHLAGNALFLWVFANNVEDRLGHGRFLAFYLAGGVVATLTYVALQPASTTPVIGASGAIAAVMGAYLVWYPRVRVRTLLVLGFFGLLEDVPAALLLAFWFVSQFFVAPGSGVAWTAHVGGFLFGVLVALLVRSWRAPTQRVSRSW